MVQRRALLKIGGILGVSAAVGAGATSLPIRRRLHDVLLVNRRDERVRVDVRVAASNERVVESTVDLGVEGVKHLSCEWPRTAWNYELAVRPADSDQWQSVTVSDGGRICEKIPIEAADESDPVTFYRSAECPTRGRTHSCATGE